MSGSSSSYINKVVLITGQPLTSKIVSDFYVDDLLKEGFSFEYWDVGEILYKRKYDLVEEEGSGKYETITFKSLKEVECRLLEQDLRKVVFIPQITYDARSFGFFKLISEMHCQTFFFARGALPILDKKKNIKSIIKKVDIKLFRKVLKKLIEKQRFRFLLKNKRNGVIKSPDVLFIAGNNGSNVIGVGNEFDLIRSRIVPINHFDFDAYLKYKQEAPVCLNSGYCVFLDEYFTRHPDFKALNIELIDEVSYFRDLNKYFDYIEKYYGLKVVIAAHPKSNYTDKPFKGREVIKHRTNDLVAHSEFVISHMSTSISFAVLYKKPLVFVSCDAIEQTVPAFHEYIQYFSAYLDAQYCNISEVNYSASETQLRINSEAYKKYAYNFLTSPETEEVGTNKVFLQTIKGFPKNKNV